mgnify:CR=1 FL=1
MAIRAGPAQAPLIDAEVVGVDLSPDITSATRLSDLNGTTSEGIRLGSILFTGLAMSFACVQLFLPTTVEAEASAQSRDGLVADYVVAAPAGPRRASSTSGPTIDTSPAPIVSASCSACCRIFRSQKVCTLPVGFSVQL